MHVMSKGLAGTVGAALLMIGAADTASAQALRPWTDTAFVNVNFGAQTKARAHSANGSEPLYDETMTWGGGFGVGSANIFDISGGYRVWRNLAVGLGFHRYSDSSSTTIQATIPDPLTFDAPHASSFAVNDLDHRERAVHLSAIWVLPVMENIDVAVFAGPSFFSLKKTVVSGVTVPPAGTSIGSVETADISRGATGGHIAVDVRYRLVRNVGVGAFFRYGAASIDAPEVNEGSIDVGGFNYGVGLRLRF